MLLSLIARTALVGAAAVVLLQGQTSGGRLAQLVDDAASPGSIKTAIGVTRLETQIPALITSDDLDLNTRKTRVLLIGGLDGSDDSVQAIVAALKWFHTSEQASGLRENFAVSAVPVANPDAWVKGMGPSNTSGGDPTRGYPPQGDAYQSETNPEAEYLWRWIGMQAPDLVVDVRAGSETHWLIPENGGENINKLAKQLRPSRRLPSSDELVSQLGLQAPSATGTVPAIQAEVKAGDGEFIETLLAALTKAKFSGPSPARKELQRRLHRSPLEVAEQLAVHYGHQLDNVVYIPAVALIGRVRLWELTKNPKHLSEVETIVAPYFAGEKPTLPEKPSGSHLSGHLVFGELARVTSKERYIELARAAADLGFDENGKPRESMPLHREMSDSVFMGGPILAQAGALSGDEKYLDMLPRHIEFIRKLDLRPDGLYRNSPLNDAAWGRGNGFPALGLALSLSYLQRSHPAREELVQFHRAHLEALLPHQDPTGAWHQVIDFPGSYRELTSTSMITFSMIRGIRLGWLERSKYEEAIERAWYAIRTRVAPNGELVDVCTSTGKQTSLRHYLDRKAILGKDDRGGAMALLAATEMAAWERE